MKINYDKYMKENHRRIVRLRLSMNLKRLSRRKPRDPEEELVLRIMAYRRWEKQISEGKIIKVGPRRYRICI
ncbi:MAG: hypothetical protein ACTSYB_03860 [Candidatus Helarchaeota archaeon]